MTWWGNQQDHWDGCCLCSFSLADIKHQSQGNLYEEGLIWNYSSREMRVCGPHGRGVWQQAAVPVGSRGKGSGLVEREGGGGGRSESGSGWSGRSGVGVVGAWQGTGGAEWEWWLRAHILNSKQEGETWK